MNPRSYKEIIQLLRTSKNRGRVMHMVAEAYRKPIRDRKAAQALKRVAQLEESIAAKAAKDAAAAAVALANKVPMELDLDLQLDTREPTTRGAATGGVVKVVSAGRA